MGYKYVVVDVTCLLGSSARGPAVGYPSRNWVLSVWGGPRGGRVSLKDQAPGCMSLAPPALPPKLLSSFPSAYHSPPRELLPWRLYRPPTSSRSPTLGLPPSLMPPKLTNVLSTAQNTLPSSLAGDLLLIL